MNESMKQVQRDALVTEALGEALQLRDEVAKIGAEIALMPANLNNVFEAAKGQLIEHIETKADASVEDMKNRFVAAITDTAKTEAEKAIEPIKQAAIMEARRLEKAARDLAATTWPVKRLFKWGLGLTVGSSLLSMTLAMIVIMSGISGKLGLSAEEKIQLQKGQQIEAVWSDLDQRTRDRLNTAMRVQAEK